MKKLLLLVMFLVVAGLIPSTNIRATFRLNIEKNVTEYYSNNVRHTYLEASLQYEGETTFQRINYFGANPIENDDIHLVVADNYLDHGWGQGTPMTMKDNIHEQYQQYEVLGGVNGDFYHRNGAPVEAYIHNFRVLSHGFGHNRTVIGFKDDGSVVFGQPDYDGYEAIIFNNDGDIKNRFDIEGINQMPTNDGSITVYFEDNETLIEDGTLKMLLNATSTKLVDSQATYYGEGTFDLLTTDALDSEMMKMVLVGESLESHDYIETNDSIVVQKKIIGEFSEVRYGLGAWEELVKDGVPNNNHTYGAGYQYRHPRTAIGVKGDGEVFFVTVDGRDFGNQVLGVTANEMSKIMVSLGAIDAYNVDGGGSSGMLLKTHDEEYEYVNVPSDGNPRPVSNGMFFVRGQQDPSPMTLPFPDNRLLLPTPSNMFVDNKNITFEGTNNASGYEIKVNNQLYRTKEFSKNIELETGDNIIEIRALGDPKDYQHSPYSKPITFVVYENPILDILRSINEMAKEAIKD